MSEIIKTVVESVNHIIANHPELSHIFREAAINSYGFNKNLNFGSINEIDKQLQEYLNFNDGFFVELGANDGISQSNTLYFERTRNWNGVLIEPYPANYLHCKRFRGNKSKIYCNACVSFDYADDFVEMVFANLMTCAVRLETDNTNLAVHLNSAKQFLAPTEEPFVFGAKARTLNSILIDARAPSKINLLSLDVAGAEIEVLKGVDHNKFRFDYICVESRDITKIKEYLRDKSYSLIKPLSEHDYLFGSVRTE